MHKLSVLFNHFIELLVPFFFFFPDPFCGGAGLLTIGFQTLLLISGNFSWLNCITIVLCFSTFSDSFLAKVLPVPEPLPALSGILQELTWCLAALIVFLSLRPIRNLFSSCQVMNCSYDRLHIVGSYGAFGSITKIRREIIIEGTQEEELSENTIWLPYEFKAKPGDIKRRPRQVTPYHYKIDWQMWFAAMSPPQYHCWFLPFIQRLLEGNSEVLALLQTNPFPDKPPKYIRAEWYEYHFADPKSGAFWTRKRLGEYLQPVYLKK